MEGDICEGASAYITEEDALPTRPASVKAIEDAELHSGRMSKGTTDVAGGLRQQIPSCNPSHGRREAQKVYDETIISSEESIY
ncbi:hypothetical protein MAR_012659 [Mya arenaria]|uniref:Uncharacterized protein n=1 Tax=Mya arenaria TaxID=6604 RepID=A0ABY7FY91_MYAAR|nr:hypothetical protein MAR_012659 [Mya arenaria]